MSLVTNYYIKKSMKKPSKYAVDTVHPTNKSGECIVVESLPKYRIKVKFPDTGTICEVSTANLSRGRVFDCRVPSHHNIGYHGDVLMPKSWPEYKKAIKTWESMLWRCYSDKQPDSYVGCSVHEEWHNFSNFLNWFVATYPFYSEEVMQLDKDIKVPGNRIYGADTCLWVTQEENLKEMTDRMRK